MDEPEHAHHLGANVGFDLKRPAFDPRFADRLDQEMDPGAVDELHLREIQADRRLLGPQPSQPVLQLRGRPKVQFAPQAQPNRTTRRDLINLQRAPPLIRSPPTYRSLKSTSPAQ